MISSYALRIVTLDRTFWFTSTTIRDYTSAWNCKKRYSNEIGVISPKTNKNEGGKKKSSASTCSTGYAYVYALYKWYSNKSVRIDLQCQWPMQRFKRPTCETVFYSSKKLSGYCERRSVPLVSIYVYEHYVSSLFSISRKCYDQPCWHTRESHSLRATWIHVNATFLHFPW